MVKLMKPGLLLLHYVVYCLSISSRPAYSQQVHYRIAVDQHLYNSVNISWSYPRGSNFTVQISRDGYQRLCPLLKDNRSFKTNRSWIYIELEEYSNYTVTVTAPNGESNSRRFLTQATAPRVAPVILMHSVTTRSVSVLWSTLHCADIGGQFDGYEVYFRQYNQLVAIKGEVIGETFMAHGLQPGTLYLFRVAARIATLGRGVFSPVLRLRTRDEYVFVDLSLSATSASANISWSYFPPNSSYYTVQLSVDRGENHTNCPLLKGVWSLRTIEPLSSILFGNLEEYSSYTVIVSAYNYNNKLIPNPMIKSFVTPSNVPTSTPQVMRINTMFRSVYVIWKAINCTGINGQFVGYQVDFRELNGTENIMGEVIGETFMAHGLRPNTFYTFKVAVLNAVSRGPFSHVFTLHTHSEVPGIVSNFSVQVLYTTVVIRWSLPHEPNGDIIAYEVTYALNGLFPTKRNVSTTFFNTPPFEINAIVSDISVRAYTSVGPGPALAHPEDVMIPSTTQPIVPPNVRVKNVPMTTSVRVEWDGITSLELGGYTIYYSSETESEQSITVPSSQNSVVIMGLDDDMEYRFQVVGVGADIRQEFIRDQLNLTMVFVPSHFCEDCTTRLAVSIASVTAMVIVILIAIVLLGRSCYVHRTLCLTEKEHDQDQRGKKQDQDSYWTQSCTTEETDVDTTNIEDPIVETEMPDQDTNLLFIED